MKIENISFITPVNKITKNKIILSREYTKKLILDDNKTIQISSHIGERELQQDCVAITENNGYLLLLVSDGIGGISNGEIASYTTAKIIKKWLDSEDINSLKYLNKKNLEDVLSALIYLISAKIPQSSGATLNMSIIGPTETLIANIGDSRTYTIKDNKITLQTTDDSLIFSKYKPTNSDERNKLRFHKENHIIINSILKHTFPNIKVNSINNNEYDTLCHLTDGITDFLTEEEIKIYSQYPNPANTLIKKCINGMPIHSHLEDKDYHSIIYPGSDNATAIIYSKVKTKTKI